MRRTGWLILAGLLFALWAWSQHAPVGDAGIAPPPSRTSLPASAGAARGAPGGAGSRHSVVEEVRTRRRAAGKRCGLFSGQKG